MAVIHFYSMLHVPLNHRHPTPNNWLKSVCEKFSRLTKSASGNVTTFIKVSIL
jgi:hypothetical protein